MLLIHSFSYFYLCVCVNGPYTEQFIHLNNKKYMWTSKSWATRKNVGVNQRVKGFFSSPKYSSKNFSGILNIYCEFVNKCNTWLKRQFLTSRNLFFSYVYYYLILRLPFIYGKGSVNYLQFPEVPLQDSIFLDLLPHSTLCFMIHNQYTLWNDKPPHSITPKLKM